MHTITTWKSWASFFKFQSISILATRCKRRQAKRFSIWSIAGLNNKTRPLCLGLNLCKKRFGFLKKREIVTQLLWIYLPFFRLSSIIQTMLILYWFWQWWHSHLNLNFFLYRWFSFQNVFPNWCLSKARFWKKKA